MNNNSVISIFACMLLVIAFSVLVGAKSNDSVNETKDIKNETYGSCVSDAAIIKNTCYASVKGKLAACKVDATNQTNSSSLVKECRLDYKKDKKQCKFDFKNAKKDCKKIKHKFLEGVKYSFK